MFTEKKKTSTMPDIHHTIGMSSVINLLVYTQCGGYLVWWMSGLVDVWCSGCSVW